MNHPAAAQREGPAAPLELWGGFECTINRVGDAQHDQCALTGHYARLDDLDRVASLGIRTLRYPALWERIANAPDEAEAWRALDERLARVRALGMDPILGLLHHGSGPRHTSLLHPGFAAELAAFARRVAERYPWVRRFTPINEPLTTARFSMLYAVWYPHRRDEAALFRAMLNQTRATRLAMTAIRDVTPRAELVQTEDLGRTHATPALGYQAEMENERRWLTGDLLAGRVRAGHAMHERMSAAGVRDDEIADAMGDGCVPDLLGINTYVTSERWLDERLDRYPSATHGGNGRHRYADVEAARARPAGLNGHASLLLEAWRRYGLPMAITETHLGGSREQQMRWLQESWDGALGAREAGADVCAVTAWAAMGLQDWSSLVTRLDGHYEPGLFDVRAPAPRPTALATMAHALATTGAHEHPALGTAGWWRCAEHQCWVAAAERVAPEAVPTAWRRSGARPLLVTGANGTLGTAMLRLCAERGLACIAVTRADVDACDRDDVHRLLRETNAWGVVNAAGYVRVDDAERERAACQAGNVRLASTLATACAERGVPFVTFSSDLVFDGCKGAPYVEGDAVSPLNVYGECKADAEMRVLAAHPGALVIRTAAFFGPWDDWNFLTRGLADVALGRRLDAADDLVVSPTYVPDLAHASLDLLVDGERGLWHLANAGAMSWAALARDAAAAAGLDASLVRGCSHHELGLAARRPANVALDSGRGWIMPTLDDALGRFVRERPWRRLLRHAPGADAARESSAA